MKKQNRVIEKMGASAGSLVPDAGKRLNLNLSARAYDELAALSVETRRSMSEIIRVGLALAKIAINEGRAGNKVVITTKDGKPIKELILSD